MRPGIPGSAYLCRWGAAPSWNARGRRSVRTVIQDRSGPAPGWLVPGSCRGSRPGCREGTGSAGWCPRPRLPPAQLPILPSRTGWGRTVPSSSPGRVRKMILTCLTGTTGHCRPRAVRGLCALTPVLRGLCAPAPAYAAAGLRGCRPTRLPAGRPHPQLRQPRGSRPGRTGGSTGAETPIRGTATHADVTVPQIKPAGW